MSDSPNNTDPDGEVMVSDPVILLTCVWSVTTATVGITGNGFALLAIAHSPSMLKNSTTAFIIALCCSGFLICSTNIPLQVALYFRRELVYSHPVCVALAFVYYTNSGATLMCLIAVTVNRYILIVHNKWYTRVFTKCKIGLMIAFCWAFPAAQLIPTLFELWGAFGFSESMLLCTVLDVNGASSLRILAFEALGLPLVVIVVCYGHIFHTVRKSRKTAHQQSITAKQSKRRLEEVKLTLMILIIFLFHTACFLPYAIVNFFIDQDQNPDLHVIVEIAVWITHCVNPVIYALVNEKYRIAYSSLLPCFSGAISPTSIAPRPLRTALVGNLPESTVNPFPISNGGSNATSGLSKNASHEANVSESREKTSISISVKTEVPS